MAEHRDASVLVMHCCEDEEHTCSFFLHGPPKNFTKSNRKTRASETPSKRHAQPEDTNKQPSVVFDALLPSDLQIHFLCSQNLHNTHTHTQTNRYKWHEAGKAGWTWGQVSAWTPSSKPVLPSSAHRPFQTGQSSERPTLTLTLCGRGT